MKRRVVLAGAGLALSTLVSGCLTEPGTTDAEDTTVTTNQETGNGTGANEGEPPTTSAETRRTDRPDRAAKIMVVLLNQTATKQLVHVALTRGEDTRELLLESDVTVAPDVHRSIDTGITETGQYDVAITVDEGPQISVPLDVENYDLGMGSNLIAEIFEDKLRVMIEE